MAPEHLASNGAYRDEIAAKAAENKRPKTDAAGATLRVGHSHLTTRAPSISHGVKAPWHTPCSSQPHDEI